MALQPSTRLGPYEIISSIGAGGMGEVYRARDTRLDRIVAIKVLPTHLSSNPQSRERFDREAKAISSLSHPHICPLYDVGHQDGVDFLVMEYLEGETLANRLRQGPLPPEQVLQYAIQITDALDTAHRHGVIHRDLKPGNIMLTKVGAKLLDFGLAKVQAAEAAAGMTQMPTETTPLTAEGTIVGTMQYMAPEQLEGHEADTRTDIFALGAVLYEMATGRRAFEGKSRASLIAAILERDPPPISTLQTMAPPALDHVVRTCLAKDPDARWQTAHDVLVELKWLKETGSQASASRPAMSGWHTRELLPWTLLAGVSLFAVVLTLVHFRQRPPETHTMRLQVPLPEKMRMEDFDFPVISPDGQRLIIPGIASDQTRHLWLRSLDSLNYQLLPETEDGYFPFWSPDSRIIAFFTNNKLKRVDAAGGPAQTICDVVSPNGATLVTVCQTQACALGGTWNREGVILFSGTDGSGIFRVSAAGGEPKAVLQLDKSRQETGQLSPQFLPDGRHFVYASQGGSVKGGIYAGLLDSSETWRLSPAESTASYAPPGVLIYGLQEALVAQSIDPTRLQIIGDAVPTAEHVGRMAEFPVSLYSVSQSGVLVYRSPVVSDLQLAWYSRDGKRLQSLGEPRRYREMFLSSDERRLAVELSNGRDVGADIWTVDLSTGIFSRLTFDASDVYPSAAWSPDGKELIFHHKDGLYRKMVGGRDEELVYKSVERLWPYKWFKDGSILLLNYGGKSFYQLRLAREHKLLMLMTSEFDKDQPSISPDERWVAYNSLESGRSEVYLAAFPTFTEKRQVSVSGGCQPFWRKDSKELFYLTLSGKLMAAEIKAGAAAQTGVPRVLFQTPVRVVPYLRQYSMTADGKNFLFGEPINEGAEQITIVLNWAAGLKR